jgi:hypothetical protein
MMPERGLADLVRSEVVTSNRFDPRSAAPFINKLVSEETRA